MREYKFRGKIIDHRTRFLKTLGYKAGDWIYGQNISVEDNETDKDKCHVFICGVQVNPDTVGEFTGLKDFKDNPVFNGDILVDQDLDEDMEKDYGTIFWSEESARFFIQFKHEEDAYNTRYYTVIGNVWDNPELLEQDSEE